MDNSYKLEKRAVIAAVSSTLSRGNEYDTGQVCRKVKNAINQWTASHNRKVIKTSARVVGFETYYGFAHVFERCFSVTATRA